MEAIVRLTCSIDARLQLDNLMQNDTYISITHYFHRRFIPILNDIETRNLIPFISRLFDESKGLKSRKARR